MCVFLRLQENCRLEEDLSVVKLKLTEAESSVNRLQRDLDQLLHDKVTKHTFNLFDRPPPASTLLSYYTCSDQYLLY